MGMTIDEAENYLIALKHCETCEANDTNICKTCAYYRRGSSAKCYDAINVALETMHKYQKIEHIMKDVAYLDKDEYKVASIMEIIKDDRS